MNYNPPLKVRGSRGSYCFKFYNMSKMEPKMHGLAVDEGEETPREQKQKRRELQRAEDLANLEAIKQASSFKRPDRPSNVTGKKMPEQKIGRIAVDEGEETPEEEIVEKKIEELKERAKEIVGKIFQRLDNIEEELARIQIDGEDVPEIEKLVYWIENYSGKIRKLCDLEDSIVVLGSGMDDISGVLKGMEEGVKAIKKYISIPQAERNSEDITAIRLGRNKADSLHVGDPQTWTDRYIEIRGSQFWKYKAEREIKNASKK